EFLLLEIGNSAATTSREELDFREPIAGKQPAKNNQPREFDRQNRNSHPLNNQPEEDSLSTLLDEVAAQSSTTTQNNRDLDQFLGDLGSSEFAEELTETSEYLPDLELDTFDRESNESFEQNGGSQNYGWDAEAALNLLEMEDSWSLSTSGDDSDFSELLDISSGFLTAESQLQELRNDRDPTARHPEKVAIEDSLNIKLDPELEASLDPNWMESAFGLEDESNFQTNLELDGTDLDALFGSITSDPISSDQDSQPDLKLPLTGPTSQEAADLAELFDSIPTGIEGYEREEDSVISGELGEDWLIFESDAESPNVELKLQDDDLESLFSGPEVENSDEQLENLEMVEFESLSDRRGSETSTAAADESSAFDFLEEMFGETPSPSTDSERRDFEDRTYPTEEFSTEHPAGLIDQSSADLIDGIQTDIMNLDEGGDDDLFDGLEIEDAGGELENLLTEPDEQFESDDLWSGLETGATFNGQKLESFDELLDSIDAQALVTAELSTGFWETDDLPEESDSAQLEGMDFSELFDASERSSEKDEGNFDELEALLIADGSGAVIDISEEARTIPVSSQIFSELEELLSERETMPEIHEQAPKTPSRTEAAGENQNDDNFDDLEKLLEDTPDDRSRQGESNIVQSAVKRRSPRAGGFGDQTMRVPVKQLDNLSNLMGELVVNRNSLEQDQERMRQFLDNLLHQVTLLSDVSQRTQDFYERSLLEIALLANRQGHRSPWRSEESSHHRESAWRPEEMDRFTPFHSLAQEIIELIVRVRESAADIEFLVDEADQVTRQLRQVTTQLQEGLTKARMKPFAETTDRLFRAVREIAIKCGKQAQLQVEGKEILIDKMIVDQLYDPMTHLVNNAITHGIEPPEVRLAAGKPAIGRITIRAFHQGNQTVISVSDDGAGIDLQKVKGKAIKQGLLTAAQAQRMSRSEVYDLLFKPGFSTQEQATEFSGRGVGMDVVLTSLQEIRGTVGTDSTIGKGTVFTIRLPLVLSISKALCCISDRARIAFPMDGVEDMIDVPRDQVTTGADGQPCIEWRGSTLPFRPLRELLAYNRHLGRGSVYGFNTDDDMISVIVLRSSGNFLAVQVDQVSTEQEIVIKQLEGPVPKPLGIAGATVLGDGRIVAIADVLELIDLATGKLRKDTPGTLWDEGVRVTAEPMEEKAEPTVLIVDDSITVRSLLSITFEKAGYRVEEARDGKEAWEKMKSGLPCDIVFCDIEMPRMDGLELLSRMQKDPVLCDLPIAMLTSRGADRHRQMAYGLGAKGYFTKPYLEEQLMDAASRMLKGEVVGAPVVV
ncbi:MAG: hybrid sensor histidine kinase/response regulator, partial [Microcoleus sp.]